MDDLFHLFPDLPWPRSSSTAGTLRSGTVEERVDDVRRRGELNAEKQRASTARIKHAVDVGPHRRRLLKARVARPRRRSR